MENSFLTRVQTNKIDTKITLKYKYLCAYNTANDQIYNKVAKI